MDNKLFFQNSLGHSYTFALIVTQFPTVYIPYNIPPTYKDCEVYSLPSQGEADGASFEHFVTVIITARGRLDQRCCIKLLA